MLSPVEKDIVRAASSLAIEKDVITVYDIMERIETDLAVADVWSLMAKLQEEGQLPDGGFDV